MTSQQLLCFIKVADKLNFTKAAEELFLSPPTVTHHIKSLEEELKTSLFIRTSKIVKLTETGTLFYSDAKEILAAIELAGKKLQRIKNSDISFLRIGCSSSSELAILEKALRKMKELNPKVYPQIFVQDYISLKTLFNNKQLDIFLATKEMTIGLENFSFKKLRVAKNYAVFSKDFALSSKKLLRFEDLSDECLIILPPKFIPFQNGNNLQEKILLHTQSHFNIVCESDQAGILLAKCGYGIAILPDFFIPESLDNLIILPIEESYTIDYGIAYHKHPESAYIMELIKSLYEVSSPCK